MQISRYFKLLPALWILLLAVPAVVWAASPITQSYETESALPLGSMASLKRGSSEQIQGANSDNNKYLLGVVVDGNSAPLAVSSGQKNHVMVATSGFEQVLVSDINGKVEVGDSITTSPITGVGMRATSNTKVLGIAQDSFPNNNAKRQNYKDKQGQEQSVLIGQVPVQINVSYFYIEPNKSIVPQALQDIANSVAGKPVNSLPILISMGIFFVTMIVVSVIVYSMIRSSIISVGRNPMSQSAVYRNVIQLSAIVVVILLAAVGSIYMVLTRL